MSQSDRRKRARDRQGGGQLQHDAEHTRPRGRTSLLSYLVILFGAAFLLLLLSYFMQQRQNAEATSSALQQSASATETLRIIQQENQGLRSQVEELERENAGLRKELGELEEQVDQLMDLNTQLDSARRTQNLALEALTDEVKAMQWFWQIDDYYVRNYRAVARQLMEQFESLGLADSLSDANTTSTNRFSPAARYKEIRDDLFQ